jgi:hypothetical protein
MDAIDFEGGIIHGLMRESGMKLNLVAEERNATVNEKDSIGSAHAQNLEGRGRKIGVSAFDRMH